MLALVGTVACGAESPVSPGPQGAALPRDIKAPTSASFLNYLTPQQQAEAEVTDMAKDATTMGNYVDPITSTTSATLSTQGKTSRRGPGDIGVMYIPAGGCKKEYIECVYDCLYLKVEFRWYSSEFWRAHDEFWSNIWSGKHYLNTLMGGPQDQMGSNFYQMRQVYNTFKGNMCKNYLQ